MFLRELDPALYMVGQNQMADLRLDAVVRVFAVLVFHEVIRSRDLPDIVEEAAHSGEDRVTADFFGGHFGEACQNGAMEVGTGRPRDERFQDRVIEVSELEQPDVRIDTANPFDIREKTDDEHRGGRRDERDLPQEIGSKPLEAEQNQE